MHKLTRIAALALLAIAILLAVSALVVGKRNSARKDAPVAGAAVAEHHRILIATQDLPAGVAIGPDQLSEVQRPGPGSGSVLSVADAIGKVPLRTISKGSAIDPGVFATGLATMLQPGERALAVPVDELAGASNRIAPGDFVDVFLSLKPSRSAEDVAPQSRLLLSRLRVLAYGGQDLQVATAAPEAEADDADPRARQIGNARNEGNDGANPGAARTALLAVPVEHANALFLGAQAGKLFLALRNPADPALADASLFPQPLPVLRARARADGSADPASPENAAYSGIDLEGLAGQRTLAVDPAAPRSAPARPAARREAPRAAGIEIIRGSGARQH
jgi:pilus assembly protein CpaB